MKLGTLEQHWTALGETDPLWAILSTPGKRGGAWNLDEFFATGPPEIEDILRALAERGIESGRGRALDFGCGIGRLTRALAEHFERCDGVDVAASMIEQATALPLRPASCHFHHNAAAGLGLFPDATFDFALSLLVFQHMEPDLMKPYIRELVRVLRADGIAYFNVPDTLRLGTELEPAAMQAQIECVTPPAEIVAGDTAALALSVRNASDRLWPATARVLAGNHWLALDDTVVVADDGRAAIDTALPGGARVELTLNVLAPETPGSYQLEIDLLQEHLGWFGHRGSGTLRIAVRVLAGDRQAGGELASADRPLVPHIEMHALSRTETIAQVEAAGGVVLEVIPVNRCGPSAPSFDYVVARSPSGVKRRATVHRESSEPVIAPGAPDPASLRNASDLGALVRARADLLGAGLSSRHRWLGPLSIGLRGLLRRGMLETLSRQADFNHAAAALIIDLERELERQRTDLEAHAEVTADYQRTIAELRAAAEPAAHGQPPPPR